MDFNLDEASHKQLSKSDILYGSNATMLTVNTTTIELVEHLKLNRAELAQRHNHPNLAGAYSSFSDSPAALGTLQFDMWNVKPSDRWEWDLLREEILKNGVRNSLLLAPMPTASTAQILGNNECFEPYTSNIYTRRVLSGEFIIVNKHLLRDLVKLGIWDDRLKNKLMASNGSIQNIDEIPDNIKNLYKTAWEISQKVLLDMAADRGAFIDQSQSLNIFMENANFAKLTSMHFYGWKAGLKTGMYYLRTKSATDAIKFTLDKEAISEPVAKNEETVEVTKK